MDQITSDVQLVSALFTDARYSIDYYQREYRWNGKQVDELLDDLFDTFHAEHREGHRRPDVISYGRYFLGPIILSKQADRTDIVDGQQRLTTLTLLLIALRHRLSDEEQRNEIANLVIKTRFGEHTFTMAVPEREMCMASLYSGEASSAQEGDPSVRNLLARYGDIEEDLEQHLSEDALPLFTDWLMHRVVLASVVANNETDAYTIFETMNDRGLRLTMPEMLRGYLLSRITSEKERTAASDSWKQQINQLQELGKEEDVDAIRAWLRSQYAVDASQFLVGTQPGDYERIGNEFHRWVRDVEQDRLGLRESRDFSRFITDDFTKFTERYALLRSPSRQREMNLETVGFIASQRFTLQYTFLLAPPRRAKHRRSPCAKFAPHQPI